MIFGRYPTERIAETAFVGINVEGLDKIHGHSELNKGLEKQKVKYFMLNIRYFKNTPFSLIISETQFKY